MDFWEVLVIRALWVARASSVIALIENELNKRFGRDGEEFNWECRTGESNGSSGKIGEVTLRLSGV